MLIEWPERAPENPGSMMALMLEFEDGRREQRKVRLPLSIGRDPVCGLSIRAWRVARQHARLVSRRGGLWIEDLGSLAGTWVNGRRVAVHGPLRVQDEIVIGPCRLRIPAPAASDAPDAGAVPSAHSSDREAPVPVLSGVRSELRAAAVEPDSPLESLELPALSRGTTALREPEVSAHRPELWIDHRRRLHDALLAALQLRHRNLDAMSDAALRAEAQSVLTALVDRDTELPSSVDREQLIRTLVDEAVGLGPLEPLLADPHISEIMVNRHDEVFVERGGRLMRAHTAFSSDQAVLGIIERIVSPLGRRIDDSSPMVDARLRDGSRVNAVVAPIALRGPTLTIRKFPARRLTMDDLLAAGSLDSRMARFLDHCVRHRKNLVVSGGTGSGKTSLLNILSNAIPSGERIITIEDAAELRLNHAHLVSLEARPANAEGRGKVVIRDLVRNALRMRPDRIVVGECRGGEAFDMLAAMNTGHEGSLTTLHANSPRDALARLETMILMAGMDLPLAAVREQIAASIDLIVQLVRVPDGRRIVSAVVEVTGMEAGRIQLQTLFSGQAGPPAAYTGAGLLPDCLSGEAALEMALFVGQTLCDGNGQFPVPSEGTMRLEAGA